MAEKQRSRNLTMGILTFALLIGAGAVVNHQLNEPSLSGRESTSLDMPGPGPVATANPSSGDGENQATDVASDGRTEYDYLIDALDMKTLQKGTSDYLLTFIRDKNTGAVTCLYDPSFSGTGDRFSVKESTVTDMDGAKVVAAQFSYNTMTHFQYGPDETKNRKNYLEYVNTFKVFLRGADVMVRKDIRYTPGEFYRDPFSSIGKLLPSQY